MLLKKKLEVLRKIYLSIEGDVEAYEDNEIKIKYLVLWLADSCNLNCKYCYAHSNFTNKFMSFEIAKKAIDLYETRTLL